jgi:hypothetical protein
MVKPTENFAVSTFFFRFILINRGQTTISISADLPRSSKPCIFVVCPRLTLVVATVDSMRTNFQTPRETFSVGLNCGVVLAISLCGKAQGSCGEF